MPQLTDGCRGPWLLSVAQVLNRLDRQDKYGYFRNEDAWTPRPGYSGPCTLADIRDRVEVSRRRPAASNQQH